MKNSLPKKRLTLRSVAHDIAGMFVLAVLDGWPVLLAVVVALAMSAPADAAVRFGATI